MDSAAFPVLVYVKAVGEPEKLPSIVGTDALIDSPASGVNALRD
jgi:hypothetical protein